MTETLAARINEIKEDVKGTLHTLEESKHDRSPRNSWTDEYLKVVMENQLWLVEKVESIRAARVGELVKENARLRESLVVAYSHCIDDEMDETLDVIRMSLDGNDIGEIWAEELVKGYRALEESN